MNFLSFFLLLLKRTCKKKSFLVILLLYFLCMLFLSRSASPAADSRIPVGICVDTEDTLALSLCDKLISGNDSLFRFVKVQTLDELTLQIENGSFECGYLFRKPLFYELEKKHLHNLVRIYVSETTTCKGVLNEYVYAALFEEYAKNILINCLKKAGQLPFTEDAAGGFGLPPVTDEMIESIYRAYIHGNETFTFEIYTAASGHTPDKADEAPAGGTYAAVAPLFHGLTALFLLLGGFLALLSFITDRERGLYDRICGQLRPVAAFLSMLSVLLPFWGVSFLAILLFGTGGSILTELAAGLVYLCCLLLFYGILGTLIKNPTMLCGAFPMLVLLTIVFTPVITDLSVIFPWIRTVRHLLPAYYYLLFF